MADPAVSEDSIILDHARSFHAFTLVVKWACITLGSIIAALIVAFAAGAGVFAGLVTGAVVFGVGVYAMTHGLAHSSEGESLPRRLLARLRG